MVLAFRRHMLLPLDDCLYTLQLSLPHLTRSALHRCPASDMASRACLIWRGPGRSGRSSNAPPQALASGARTDGAALARSTSTSPGCKPVTYEEDRKRSGQEQEQDLIRGIKYPANAFSRRMAVFVRWHHLFVGIDRTSRFAVTEARRQGRQNNSLGIPSPYARSCALPGSHHSHRSSH